MLLITKGTFDSSIIIDRYGPYKKYSIFPGTETNEIRSLGKWSSYSLKPYQLSDESNTPSKNLNKYQLILLYQQIDKSVNLCQEQVT